MRKKPTARVVKPYLKTQPLHVWYGAAPQKSALETFFDVKQMKEDAKKKAAAEGNPEFVAQVAEKIKKEKDSKTCDKVKEEFKKEKDKDS